MIECFAKRDTEILLEKGMINEVRFKVISKIN